MGSPSEKIRLLIVEDEQAQRYLYKRYLQDDSEFSYSFFEAENIKNAKEILYKERPNFVILDNVLPDGCCIDFLESEKEYFSQAEATVVILTAHGSEKLAVDSMKSGADDYLLKEELSKSKLTQTIHMVTEKKSLQRQVEDSQSKAMLAAKMASLGEMASEIAHEINNPLTVINGYAARIVALLQSNNFDEDKILLMAQKIERTSQRVGKIIKGLRVVARDGENDPFELTNISNIVEDTLEICRERFKYNEVDLRIEAIPDQLELECIAVQISQVLINLVMNAFDAVLELEERWVEISAKKEAEQVVFMITDSGPGISAEIRSKILQPFFTTKDIGKGTGLGLSISKSIIERHKGEFLIDDQCANTRFVIKLPIKQVNNNSDDS